MFGKKHSSGHHLWFINSYGNWQRQRDNNWYLIKEIKEIGENEGEETQICMQGKLERK